MVTGFNTDVRYGSLVLHVQTEDKGRSNPYIESLIYCGGQVVAARRASYSSLLAEGKSEADVLALMEQQHRTLIRAIRAGKFDERIQEFMPDAGKEEAEPEQEEQGSTPITGTFQIEDSSRSLDQVILDYLAAEAEEEQLVLVMENGVDLRSGTEVALTLHTSSSVNGDPVQGASVNVKLISTLRGPRTLADGETDDEGILQLPVAIPEVEHGTAALIITAASGIGTAELKHLL